MKKILVVNDTLHTGGIQKSLLNFLDSLCNEYEITLLLFKRAGEAEKLLPPNVNIIYPRKIYGLIGFGKQELKRRKNKTAYLLKCFFVGITKIFSKKTALNIMGITQRKIRGYDIVISYSHSTYYKDFRNGCAEFVLSKTKAKEKICFIHCD